ncbi:hypothetical protein EPO17_00360 [Patescibacteria group bacterium]|nr:MAG: hypothetical protein EPO17_00360 [Patescibacteria group bacterium]
MGKSFKKSLLRLMEMSGNGMTTESQAFVTSLICGAISRNTPLAIKFINLEGHYADLLDRRSKRWLNAAKTLIYVKLMSLIESPEQMLAFRLQTENSDAWKDESILYFWGQAFGDSFQSALWSEQFDCLAMLLLRCDTTPRDHRIGEFARAEFRACCADVTCSEGTPVYWLTQLLEKYNEVDWSSVDYKELLGCIVTMTYNQAYWKELCLRHKIP